MTMFPAHLPSSKHVNGDFSQVGCDCFISLGRGFSDLMAEDESRTETSINYEEEGSSSKDANTGDDDHGRWLQLSLGDGRMESTTTQMLTLTREPVPSVLPSVTLNLFTGGGSSSSSTQITQLPPPSPPPPQIIFQVPEFPGHLPMSVPFFLQPRQTATAMNSVPFMTLEPSQQQQQQPQHETNYNYLHLIRTFPTNMMTTPLNLPVSSSSSFSSSSHQQGYPFHIHRRLNVTHVINPPRRPHSGVWFMLQASQNQAKEPFLPQIPKSYLRIKDGRMTVGLLIKFLVNKLELGSESEVEMTCKGHKLLSTLTLQHVRDSIWNSPRNDVAFSVIPQSSATINHLMVLNYGRIA
ncbi:hypothetical protein R6Q57_022178 [Mikania cordata]